MKLPIPHRTTILPFRKFCQTTPPDAYKVQPNRQRVTCKRRPAVAMLRKVWVCEVLVLQILLFYPNSRLRFISAGNHGELWRRHPCPERLSPDRWRHLQEQKDDAGHPGCGTAGNQDGCLQQGHAVQSGIVVLKIIHFSLIVNVFMLSRCISLLFCSADVCVPGEEQRLGEPTGGAASLLRCLCQRHRGELAQKMRRVEEEKRI